MNTKVNNPQLSQPLVSVVIPIYNVEEYLERCIDSVLSQSYQHLEVILVNDGSTDGCEAICRRYEQDDSRIRYISQANKGLSGARNTGKREAKGEYLMFLDSDDWIHRDCIGWMVELARKHDAQMVIGDWLKVSEMATDKPLVKDGKEEILNMTSALTRMLQGEFISAWNKLFKKSLFQEVDFPEGRNNEDYAVLTEIFEQCSKIVVTHNTTYYYYSRQGSITHSRFSIRSFDEYYNGITVYDYVKKHHPDMAKYALFNLTASMIKLIGVCTLWDPKGIYSAQLREMRSYLKSHFWAILFNPALGIQYKPFVLTIRMGDNAHRRFLKLYNRYIKK